MWNVFLSCLIFIVALALLALLAIVVRKRGLSSLLNEFRQRQTTVKRPLSIIQRKALAPQLHLAEVAWGDAVYLLAIQRDRVTVIDHLTTHEQDI